MHKRKALFITFEGIEGSGKSYQSRKLYKNLKKKKASVILTREPGGTRSAEIIREVILKDYFHKDTKEKYPYFFKISEQKNYGNSKIIFGNIIL